MKGMISMILIGALALTLSGCHAPVDAAATAPTRETTVPTAAETQPGTSPAGIERPEPEDADFVRVRDYLPDVLQELPYAGTENFTGHRIYEFTEVFLRYGTVKKLQAVCAELAGQGLTLKIWDGFRPVSAQFRLWEVCHDDTYVANPNRGFSAHSRGNTVDVTLVDSLGNELEMPTTIFPARPTGTIPTWRMSPRSTPCCCRTPWKSTDLRGISENGGTFRTKYPTRWRTFSSR